MQENNSYSYDKIYITAKPGEIMKNSRIRKKGQVDIKTIAIIVLALLGTIALLVIIFKGKTFMNGIFP
jgi:hypothetical protein